MVARRSVCSAAARKQRRLQTLARAQLDRARKQVGELWLAQRFAMGQCARARQCVAHCRRNTLRDPGAGFERRAISGAICRRARGYWSRYGPYSSRRRARRAYRRNLRRNRFHGDRAIRLQARAQRGRHPRLTRCRTRVGSACDAPAMLSPRRAYTLLLYALLPLALVKLAWRARRQRGYLEHIPERF